MRRLLLFALPLLSLYLLFLPPLVSAQAGCVGYGIACSDILGNPTATCCDPLQCNTPDPGLGFLTCGIAPAPGVFCATGASPSVNPGADGIRTALGCIPYDIKPFISTFLTWASGIALTIVFFVLLYAAFLIITAGGDPKKVAAGRELLAAALTGLLLIALSIVILNFLGISFLGLDSLGFSV